MQGNLRAKIKDFETENPALELNREVLVRSISFQVSQGKEIGRSYILSNLSHQHFNEHWGKFTSTYKSVHDFLRTSRLLIHPTWMPYENMILPLMAFAAKLPHHDFSQISADQASLIPVWYWLAVFSRRYSSAAQTYALEDAQALQKAADGKLHKHYQYHPSHSATHQGYGRRTISWSYIKSTMPCIKAY
jgi:hypothetical protein